MVTLTDSPIYGLAVRPWHLCGGDLNVKNVTFCNSDLDKSTTICKREDLEVFPKPFWIWKRMCGGRQVYIEWLRKHCLLLSSYLRNEQNTCRHKGILSPPSHHSPLIQLVLLVTKEIKGLTL